MGNEEISLSTIGQIAIQVRDLDKAVIFYRDVLGMKFLYQYPGLAFFDCTGIRLMLSLPEGKEFKYGSILYFKVPDVQQAYSILLQRGVGFIEEPHLIAKMPDHDLWMAFFNDLDGNTLALMCEIRQNQ